jgi:uncharacterized membrane protein
MLKLLGEYSSKIFFLGLLLSCVMVLPVFICAIMNFITYKKLPKILLSYGFEELSQKIIKAQEYKGGYNRTETTEWQETQLSFQEFRHLNILYEHKKLLPIQNIDKITFIATMVFFVFLLLGSWGMGLGLISATLLAISNKETLRLIVIMALFSIGLIWLCVIMAKLVFTLRKYY